LVALFGALAVALIAILAVTWSVRGVATNQSTRVAVKQAVETRIAGRDEAQAAQDRVWDVPFAEGMVRETARWKDPTNGPTLDVAFVNATPGADLASSARACAKQYAASSKRRTQCYAFATTAAYDFKNITKDMELTTPTALVNLCWAVLAEADASGRINRVSDMRDAEQVWAAQQCPSSWKGASA
jgi:hypothetical protein